MQVIGVGFLRTGTTSLTMALEQLGYGACYHIRMLNNDPQRAAEWIKAADDRASADWAHMFAGYESSVGSPGAMFWPEISAAFPDAKIILTVREARDWYASAERTVVAALKPAPLLVRLLTWRGPHRRNPLDDLQRLIWAHEFGELDAEPAGIMASFEQHIAAVQAAIPPTRLLVFDVRDGWPPLCEFLGVREPSTPFPRENDTPTFQRRQRTALTRTLTRRATAVTGLFTATLAAWAIWRRASR